MAARRMVTALGSVVLVAGLLGGCQIGSSAPTSTVSLAHDQAVVNQDKATIVQDQTEEQVLATPDTDPNSENEQCLSEDSPTCDAYWNKVNADGRKLDAKLKRDQFQLQVAQDQLKKDEG